MDVARWRQSLFEPLVGERAAVALWQALEADASQHPQGAASLWPRLAASARGGLLVCRPGPHAAALCIPPVLAAQSLPGLQPELPLDAYMALEPGASPPSLPPPEWPAALAVLRLSPFCLRCPHPEHGWVARTNPVRMGRAGAAIWNADADAFVPLGLTVLVSPKPSAEPVEFLIAVARENRRPWSELGRFHVFHGPLPLRSHAFLLRSAQAFSRAGATVAYRPDRLRAAIEAEVRETKGLHWRGADWREDAG